MKIFKSFLYIYFAFVVYVQGQEKLSLAGTWQVKLDPNNQGIAGEWWKNSFAETVKLPGSLTENNIGYKVDLNTPWTGNVIDSTYFRSDVYKKYRTGDIKVPFWLLSDVYYRGVAWYTRTIEVPQNWKGKNVVLNLERCHWESSVYVNEKYCGTQNSLVAKHDYDIGPYLKAGNNRITIRVNNNYIIPIGPNSSSITDHTQTNWNGIIGDISLNAYEKVKLKNVKIFTDIKNAEILVKYQIVNPSREKRVGKISFSVAGYGEVAQNFDIQNENSEAELVYKLPNAKLWDEFTPNLYALQVKLFDDKGTVLHSLSESFGMRKVSISEGRVAINDRPVFLRGDVDCAGFPLTGYPSTDETEWERIFKTIKSYGLNHLRFHSWCPPKIAFSVADRLGVYIYPESPVWANQGSAVGTGGVVDDFIYAESERIIEEYGNHPSFIMMSSGNEPAGAIQNAFLSDWVNHFKAKDNRRLYTSSAGWPMIPANDVHITPNDVRIQGWGQELKSIINSKQPSFDYNWQLTLSKIDRPVVSHEIGQWCAFPNLKEISKYKGVLKAKNFEIFKETLEQRGMGSQADEFLYASGRLQTLCYKADIEAALRTPKFGGFQLLGLHDFSGQGTALVGALDAFWESKGYTSPEEYRTFCNSTVLLAKFQKLTFTNKEIIDVPLDIAHFGNAPLKNQVIEWQFVDANNKIYGQGNFAMNEIKIGDSQYIGNINFLPNKIKTALQLKLKTNLKGTDIKNHWDIWVYPSELKISNGNVLIVDELTDEVISKIQNGQNVLYLANGDVKDTSVKIGFSSLFWNTAWTGNQAPHTMGLALNPAHPVFKHFPTEQFSNYQWFDLIIKSQAIIINGFDKAYKPLLQPIDTWFENRKLAIGFETNLGKGKLMVTSIDLTNDMQNRIEANQFKYSLLAYMNSTAFAPEHTVDIQKIKVLFK